MTKTPCIRPEGHPVPISAWVSPLGYSFGHQVADDAKTGSGTTEKHQNHGFLRELAVELFFYVRPCRRKLFKSTKTPNKMSVDFSEVDHHAANPRMQNCHLTRFPSAEKPVRLANNARARGR